MAWDKGECEVKEIETINGINIETSSSSLSKQSIFSDLSREKRNVSNYTALKFGHIGV